MKTTEGQNSVDKKLQRTRCDDRKNAYGQVSLYDPISEKVIPPIAGTMTKATTTLWDSPWDEKAEINIRPVKHNRVLRPVAVKLEL